MVLGITRPDGAYVGVPDRDTVVHPGDLLIVYGRGAAVERLAARRDGFGAGADRAAAVAEQRALGTDAAPTKSA